VIKALRYAVDDYLDQDELEVELVQALARWRATLPAQSAPGRILALIGACGGCGTSTIAVNLATLLAQKKATTLLVDLRLNGGDLGALLDLRPDYNLADLCANVNRLDSVLLERTLVPHPTGLQLLAGPRGLADLEVVQIDVVRQILALTRSSFRHILLDAELGPRGEQGPLLKEAETIVVVTRLDFVALRHTRSQLDALERLGINPNRVQVVVNRYGQPKEVALAKAEMALERKLKHLIPDDAWRVNRANNAGVPLVQDSPSSKVAKALMRLADALGGGPQEAGR
jgi:pilus assembly protein CpaE